MSSEVAFRLDQTRRFLMALLMSQEGRRFLFSHLLSTLLLAALLFIASLVAFQLIYDRQPGQEVLITTFSAFAFLLIFIPLAAMPFFSFKDLINHLLGLLNRKAPFTQLSDHVFYRLTPRGQMNLHLAKAHTVLAEKHRLLQNKAETDISYQLAYSVSSSIRDAAKVCKDLIRNGKMRADLPVTGVTYSYIFGSTGSKMRLRRHDPGRLTRYCDAIFYRFASLHGVYMYFVIHEKLPPSCEIVYYVSTIGDIVGIRPVTPA